jgi:hypothetical protein
MTATMDDYDGEIEIEKIKNECHAEAAEQSPIVDAQSEEPTSHGTLPWIGALANPRIGPMVVIDDGGYLVPLWTAGDLLRGCRYFWRAYAGRH